MALLNIFSVLFCRMFLMKYRPRYLSSSIVYLPGIWSILINIIFFVFLCILSCTETGDSVSSDESFCKINEFSYYIHWCKTENVSKSKIFRMFSVWYFRLKFHDRKRMKVETLEDWNSQLSQQYVISTCIQSFYLVIGVVGNILVIVLYRTKMESKNDDRYFIPAIAIIDLIGCMFSITLSLLNNERPVMFPGSFTCKLIQFGTCSSIISSLFMLLVISIQRFQKICRPFGFQMNLNHKRFATAVAVLLACSFSIPMLLLYQRIEVKHETKNITGYICGSAPGTEKLGDSTRAILITVEVGAVFSMTIFYALVGRKLIEQFKMSRKLHDINSVSSTSNSGSNERSTIRTVVTIDAEVTDQSSKTDTDKKTFLRMDSRKESCSNNSKNNSTKVKDRKKSTNSARRYSVMFMVISLIAILCYIPPWTFVILEAKDSNFWRSLTYEEVQIFLTIRRLYIVNHIANPFIYGFFDQKFRGEVKSLLCSCKYR